MDRTIGFIYNNLDFEKNNNNNDDDKNKNMQIENLLINLIKSHTRSNEYFINWSS